MTAKIHVNGKVKSVTIINRNRIMNALKKFKFTINMVDKDKIFLYTDQHGLELIKIALDEWWKVFKSDLD